MNKKHQQIASYVFGIVFLCVLLALAVIFPNPTIFQYTVFRVVLALAAAGVTAMIPGFLEVTIPYWLRASGSLAIFALIYFYNPASLVTSSASEISSKPKTNDSPWKHTEETSEAPKTPSAPAPKRQVAEMRSQERIVPIPQHKKSDIGELLLPKGDSATFKAVVHVTANNAGVVSITGGEGIVKLAQYCPDERARGCDDNITIKREGSTFALNKEGLTNNQTVFNFINSSEKWLRIPHEEVTCGANVTCETGKGYFTYKGAAAK